ncbi:MAG TPA: SWIM zinc finger family protein [Ktedonobacterales bacterium]|nr:SWIM zinc finger family protein [Ktedonobacterales bacterium]
MPTITAEQVLALAPDSSSAQAGRKLAAAKHWKSMGRDGAGLWGECLGSALYQVRVDLSSLSVKCSCPSRKFPCKHGIGLLLLAAEGAVPEDQQPEWMASWMAKRAATKEAPKTVTPDQPVAGAAAPDAQAQVEAAKRAAAKRVEKRQRLMTAGLDGLDLWLSDLMRNGLGGLEARGASFWESQAARMVDAQAPGVANRLRRMAGIPGASEDWPERLLAELGKLALLSHAWQRLDALDPPLRDTVRQAMGWNLSTVEVDTRGELVSDRWAVLGQWVDDSGERIRVQRTWLLGERSQRSAVIMQFATAYAPFAEVYPPGSVLVADLRFWPGAYPQRAYAFDGPGSAPPRLLEEGLGMRSARLPGHERINGLLRVYAEGLARDPWLDRLGCALRDVIPTLTPDGGWFLLDTADDALPLAGNGHWRLLALSGGRPIDLMAEWNGETLLPLGAVADGAYIPLMEAR